jgi:GNAT superfamily N-acetyltransferase
VQWFPRIFPTGSLLGDGHNRFYGRDSLPDEITQMTWSRFFDAREPDHALVTRQDAQRLGLAHSLFHRSSIPLAPTYYLQDLFTHESARGKGIGRALIEVVLTAAEPPDAPPCELAGAGNESARHGARR